MLALCLLFDGNADWTGFVTKYSECDIDPWKSGVWQFLALPFYYQVVLSTPSSTTTTTTNNISISATTSGSDSWQQMWLSLSRVSKSCNHAIARLGHMFENLHNIWTNERKTWKLVLISWICHNLTKFLRFYSLFFACLCVKLLIRKFWLGDRISFYKFCH